MLQISPGHRLPFLTEGTAFALAFPGLPFIPQFPLYDISRLQAKYAEPSLGFFSSAAAVPTKQRGFPLQFRKVI